MDKQVLLFLLLNFFALAGIFYTKKQIQSPELQLNQKLFLSSQEHLHAVQFLHFKTQFNKQYGADEQLERFTHFKNNLKIIEEHNQKYHSGNSTFFLGVNQFADMNKEEFKAKYLGYQKTNRTKNYNYKLLKSNLQDAPTELDWVQKGAVTEVKNQGQCGSCWAYSAVGALEGLYYLTNKKLENLSEQQMIDCSTAYGNNGCGGGLMDYAFNYVAANGITTDNVYPQKFMDQTCVYQSKQEVFKIKDHVDVPANSESSLVQALAQQPVSVAIEADSSSFQLYAGGIYNKTDCGSTLDHGVLAVGYGSNYYIVKNSWGSSWGEKGFIKLARTGDGTGMCGIQEDASYPIV